jgi:hypothetical protein
VQALARLTALPSLLRSADKFGNHLFIGAPHTTYSPLILRGILTTASQLSISKSHTNAARRHVFSRTYLLLTPTTYSLLPRPPRTRRAALPARRLRAAPRRSTYLQLTPATY